MTDAMQRRGPDGEGIYQWDHATFGHRRLSIFDLSEAGAQPMLSPDGSAGVVFNGAIYNFKELRSELESRGYTFRSHTDTEVLVHGYDAWGIERLVQRVRGMFAFAIWDDRKQTLHLVRDRLGVKPLLYAQSGGRIAFASTAAALNKAGAAGSIDEKALAEYLEYGFVTDARCIYGGVRKLAAGCRLEWRAGSLSMHEYWRPPVPDANARPRFEDALAQTEVLFLESVRIRLEADVPVGALLSGGVDSSLVCWAIAKLGGDITAFTIAAPGDPWDESADARATAQELGLRHRVLEADPDSSPTVQDLANAYGEPFACASALGMIALSQAVKSEATVLLTGDGGDDAFLGYPRHLHYAHAQRLAAFIPRGSTPVWKSVREVLPKRGVLRRAAHFADYSLGGLGAVVNAHDGLPQYRAMGLLGDRFRDATVTDRELPWSVDAGRRVLDDFIAYERRTRFVSEYLTKVDGATMYHSLEARSPFLDQELWTFASSLPYELRLRGNTMKALLRELARRNIGERVASGAKRGFGIPAQRWIADRWRAPFRDAFEYSLLDREGWIDASAVRTAMDAVRPGDTAPVQLWHLYVLENWMKSNAIAAQVRPAV